MDIQQCFKILDLDTDASPDEAKQAYKDLVAVWHPDRFSGNPRLRHKAEERLKEINKAYEEVKSHFASARADGLGRAKGPDRNAGEKESRAGTGPQGMGRTEEMAEAGTRIVLYAWYYFAKALRRLKIGNDEPPVQGGPDGSGSKGQGGTEKGRGQG